MTSFMADATASVRYFFCMVKYSFLIKEYKLLFIYRIV